MVKENVSQLFLVRLCCQIYCGLCFTCESWDANLEEGVEALPYEASLELLHFGFCVWSLCGLGGQGGRRVSLALAGRY
jgi:hypothetical protein